MAYLHQFDYVFAIGLIFAFLDAFMIGANDVANSWATSVSSRSITLPVAMVLATFCEVSGAVGVGARVAETIRTKIIAVDLFTKEPSVLMLGMACALVASSSYLTVATRLGLPVSTTHSIMGGVIGVGVATVGSGGVNWGWKGVSQVFAAWAIAPGIAAIFGAVIFSITKYGVLRRKEPVKLAFFTVPVYFAITSGLLTMLIVWKGAASLKLDALSTSEILGCIFGVAGGVALLVITFILPFLYRLLVKEDWQLRWYHAFLGPALLSRGPIPEKPADRLLIRDFYEGMPTKDDPEPSTPGGSAKGGDIENGPSGDVEKSPNGEHIDHVAPVAPVAPVPSEIPAFLTVKKRDGPWYTPANIVYYVWAGFTHGIRVDVVKNQKKVSFLSGGLSAVHIAGEHFNNKAEYTYSLLQVLTAATSSFAHGANDVSNAIGPLSSIYLIWSTAQLSSSVPVPLWVLGFGGVSIAIGLWTYGYNIMRNLGNRITLHSPSRGFSMELGAAITVIMATRLALPISTTQCICGSTVGVGLCNGTWRSINWRMVAWIYFGWFITLPISGIISGCLMGIIINAPQFGKVVTPS